MSEARIHMLNDEDVLKVYHRFLTLKKVVPHSKRIAERMNLPLGTLMNRIRRAKKIIEERSGCHESLQNR